jgi:hypothetical protein
MAIAASFHAPYDLVNHEDILSATLDKARAAVTDGLRTEFSRAIEYSGERVLMERMQLPLARGCAGAVFTLGELCDSYKHETTAQVILPSSVEKILLGFDGLIRRQGGGRAPYLLQDVQVGYIRNVADADSQTVGPIIISGRNRLLALQAFVRLVAPNVDVRSLQLRCMAYTFSNRKSLEEAIVAANSGRDFPRSEKREKKAAAGGLNLSSKDEIRATLPGYSKQPPAGAITGTWLKFTAAEQQLNTMSAAQISDAGAGLVNRLAKDVKPNGMTLGAWFKEDSTRLIAMCEALEPMLAPALRAVAADTSVGSLPKKLASQLMSTALGALRF